MIKPEYQEKPKEEDPRPKPKLTGVKIFTNSTLKISFNEPIKFKSDDPVEIDKNFRKNVMRIGIRSGLDESELYL